MLTSSYSLKNILSTNTRIKMKNPSDIILIIFQYELCNILYLLLYVHSNEKKSTAGQIFSRKAAAVSHRAFIENTESTREDRSFICRQMFVGGKQSDSFGIVVKSVLDLCHPFSREMRSIYGVHLKFMSVCFVHQKHSYFDVHQPPRRCALSIRIERHTKAYLTLADSMFVFVKKVNTWVIHLEVYPVWRYVFLSSSSGHLVAPSNQIFLIIFVTFFYHYTLFSSFFIKCIIITTIPL